MSNRLYTKIEPYFSRGDSRGSIKGLLNFGEWREFNLIKSVKDSVRGKHYHKDTTECFIILSGKILVQFKLPQDNQPDLTDEVIFEQGDVFLIKPLVEHTFTILSEAEWINALSIPMDTENPDFHQYSTK